MKLNKIFAVFGIFLLSFLIYHQIFSSEKKKIKQITEKKTSYKFSEKFEKNAIANSAREAGKKIFIDDLVTSDLLNEFKFLSFEFRNFTSLDGHFAEVKNYLFSKYDEDYADLLFNIYKKWIRCSIALKEEFGGENPGGSPEEIIAYIKKIFDFQKSQLGDELAEKLYQDELDKKIYTIRRSAIIHDNGLYGEEKEEMLAELNNPKAYYKENSRQAYDIYREKLAVYSKDLSEADEDERNELKKKIRESVFPPEIAERLNEVSVFENKSKQMEANYFLEKDKIISDGNLSEQEKKMKIKELQTEIYGDEGAKARERIDRMEEGYQKLLSKTNNK